jgi:hypothetical protein
MMVDLSTLILSGISIAIAISNTSIILAIFAAPKIKYVRMRKAKYGPRNGRKTKMSYQ